MKNKFWIKVRGGAILAVVLIHCKNGIEYPRESFSYQYWVSLRQVINFPVAIFIFLSGYFTNIIKVKKSYKSYIFERIKRLYIPFLIWSCFYFLIRTPFMNKGEILNLKVPIKILLGLYSGPLYYILVLLQLVILLPFIIKIIEKRNILSKSLYLITPFYLCLLYWYTIKFGKNPGVGLFYATLFPAWFVFYYLGVWLKIRGNKIIFNKKNSIIIIFLALLLSMVESNILVKMNSTMYISQIKLSSFLYSISLISLFLNFQDTYSKRFKILEYLGENSYGIYFVHVFFIILFSKVLNNINIIKDSLIIFQSLQLTLTLISSCCIIHITKKRLGSSKSKMLGF